MNSTLISDRPTRVVDLVGECRVPGRDMPYDVKIISEGTLVAEGSVEEIRHSESEWVRQFIEGQADGPVPFHYPGESITQQLMKRQK